MFAVYSPRQEDMEAAGREQEWEGLREELHTASGGRTTPVQVSGKPPPPTLLCAVVDLSQPLQDVVEQSPSATILTPFLQVEQSDGPPAESQEDPCSTAMGGGVNPTTKQAQDLKVHFVVEPDTKVHWPLPEPSPPESGKPDCWLMSAEETSASGGTAYTLSYHCSTPPLPQAPPPLFTPYKPDAVGPSFDETTLDHSTSALEQNSDSGQEDELDLAAPPLPLSSPPTLTPTKDVPSCMMDGLESRMGTDLSAVLEEALQDLSQPPDELPTSKEEPLVVADPPTGHQSSEADMLNSGTYSEVFEGTGRPVVVGRPMWAVSPASAAPADSDYAVPTDSLDHKRESFDAPEGYVAYATVDGATKRTHHVTVKTMDRSLPRPVEPAGGGRPVSALSEESLYATVRPPYVGQPATVQLYSDGAPVVDSTRSKKDKLGVSLGDPELRVGLGDLGFTSGSVAF